MVAGLRQLTELFDKLYPVAPSALWRLSYKSLPRMPSQELLEVPHLICEQEGIGHKLVIKREKPLQSRDDYTENVFLCKVVHEGISVEQIVWVCLDHVKVYVPES